MATNILLKKSSVVDKAPLVGDLQFGELALNYADGRLYYKSSGNTIEHFAASVAGNDITTGAVDADTVDTTGNITAGGDVSGTNITATGDISGASLDVTGDITSDNIAATGAITAGSFADTYYNNSGATIAAGSVVYISGGSATNPTIAKSIATDSNSAITCIGIVDADILNNTAGTVTTRGLYTGIDTSSFSVGDALYVSDTTAGGLQNTKPIRPNYVVPVAIVLTSAVSGLVYVNVDQHTNAIDTINSYIAEGDPTGWINNTAITSTYDSTTRTVTLTGDLRYQWQGQILELTSPWTSPAHPDVLDNGYFLHSDDGGVTWVWTLTPWDWTEMMGAYIWYGTNDKFGIVETHSTMPWWAHQEFHQTVGTYRVGGGTLSNYVVNSTTLADRRPDVAVTSVKDEDIITQVPALTNNTYTQLYFTGTGQGNYVTGATDIIPLSGSQPYWNEWTGTAWQQTLVPNNDYVNVWLMGVPAMGDTTSQNYRYLWVQGQESNETLAEAQSRFPFDLSLGDLENTFTEFVFLAKVILVYTSNNWKIESVQDLTGSRNAATAADSNVYLSSVASDASLSGVGTTASPLSVVSAPYADQITLTDRQVSATHYIPFTDVATGQQTLYTDAVLAYNPGSDLLTVGNISTRNITVNDPGTNSIIYLKNSGGTADNRITFQTSAGADDWHIGQFNDGDKLYVHDNSTVIMAFDKVNDRVGINTTSPAEALDVNGNVKISGYLSGPATFVIDPAAVGDNTGTVVIAGDLQIDGTTTTVNSATMTVDDLNITVASGAANAAAADGGGITVDGAGATLTYASADDSWNFNKDLNVTANIVASGDIDAATGTIDTLDGVDATFSGTVQGANLIATGDIDAATGTIVTLDGTSASFDDITTDNIQLDLVNGADPPVEGQLCWNPDDQTLNVGLQNGVVLQVGQEMHYHVVNNSGVTINDGETVMAVGTVGASGQISVAKMDASNHANFVRFMGIATQSIPAASTGYVTSFGKIRGINTVGWSDGDLLYLDQTTPGALTNVQPTTGLRAPQAIVILGGEASLGTIQVRVHIGTDLEQLHDVLLTSVADDQILTYNSAASRWENNTNVTVSDAGTIACEWTVSRTASAVGPASQGWLQPTLADSASTIAYKFDTVNDLATEGAKVVSIRNAGTEIVAVTDDGMDVTGAVTVTDSVTVLGIEGVGGQSFGFVRDDILQYSAHAGLSFSSDGLKLFVASAGTPVVQEWAVGNAWDASTVASVPTTNFSTTSYETSIDSMYWRPDGLQFYILGSAGRVVRQFNLGVAWQLSTASIAGGYSVTGQGIANPQGLAFNSTGTRMYVLNDTGVATIYQYNLGQAWNLASVSYSGITLNVEGTIGTGGSFMDMYLEDDDATFWVSAGAIVYKLAMGTPGTISTTTYAGTTYTLTNGASGAGGIYVEETASKLYAVDLGNTGIREYNLPTAGTSSPGLVTSDEVVINDTLTVGSASDCTFNPDVANDASSIAYDFRTLNSLTTPGATIASFRNVDAEIAKIDYYGLTVGSTKTITTGHLSVLGNIYGPANMVIDPSTHGDDTGTVQIKGNLQVDGTTTTINSATLDVDDLNITVASGAPDAATANGAGLTVDGAGATLIYTSADDSWNFNKKLSVPSLVINSKLNTTLGENLLSTTNPNAITFLKVNADNTVSTEDAATYRASIGTETSTTGSAIIPAGTEAQRDGTPANGYLRYNSDLHQFEGYVDGEWVGIDDDKTYTTTAAVAGTIDIDSVPIADVRSITYRIQACGPDGYLRSDVTIVHNDTITNVGETFIGLSFGGVASYDAVIEGGNLVLKATVSQPGTSFVWKRADVFPNTGSVYAGGDLDLVGASGNIDLNLGSGTFDLDTDLL